MKEVLLHSLSMRKNKKMPLNNFVMAVTDSSLNDHLFEPTAVTSFLMRRFVSLIEKLAVSFHFPFEHCETSRTRKESGNE